MKIGLVQVDGHIGKKKWGNVIKSVIKIYFAFFISHIIRTNGLLYLTGHNECPLLTILLT